VHDNNDIPSISMHSVATNTSLSSFSYDVVGNDAHERVDPTKLRDALCGAVKGKVKRLVVDQVVNTDELECTLDVDTIEVLNFLRITSIIIVSCSYLQKRVLNDSVSLVMYSEGYAHVQSATSSYAVLKHLLGCFLNVCDA
jgi:hypothetical protein